MKIEDLLKLKKAEKPSQADWQKFDEELKRKMLLAIVRKEPLPKRAFTRLGIFRKPVAATAFALPVAAFAFFFANAATSVTNAPHADFIAENAVVLPNASTSFAINELSATSDETPLSVPISFSDNSRISYASSTIAATSSIAF